MYIQWLKLSEVREGENSCVSRFRRVGFSDVGISQSDDLDELSPPPA